MRELRTPGLSVRWETFQDIRTPLQIWFYAIYLFVTTRHGVSGKKLQRTLGGTYITACKIGQQFHQLMASAQDFELFQGDVEVDEVYFGGHRSGKRGRAAAGKAVALGVKERGGDIRAKSVPNAKKESLRAFVISNVESSAIVSTDEFVSYG